MAGRRWILGAWVTALSIAASGFLEAKEYARLAPFAGVRWEGHQPVVKISEEWFTLVSLDGIAAGDIVAFSQRTYKDRWQKRFEEDLVEVLTGMGHKPKDNVRLVVLPLESETARTLDGVAMTAANRQAIWSAAQARKRISELQATQQGAKRSAVSIDDAERFRARIDEFLSAARIKTGFGGVVLVARGGRPVYEGAFGFSHLESKAPNALDTPFRIASLSKQFTAAAIFRLEAGGKLNIDDPVHRHLREFAELPYRGITIHHLLTHTSGLPRVDRSRWRAMSRAATPVDDYVRLAVQMPLEFEPGADRIYSNFGYRVLSALIARITGRDYADFMEQELFQPLGMKNTGVARVTRPPSESRIADGLALLRLDPAAPLYAIGEDDRNYGTGYGSGGIYSSASDLLLWDRALKGNEFLSESQKTRLFRPVYDHYACGWIVKNSGLDGRLYQTHSGGNDGFFSRMMRIPEDDLVIITVGNVDGTPAIDDVREQLFRLCRSLPYRDP